MWNVSAARTITVNPTLGRHFDVTVCWCIECWRDGLERPQMRMISHMWRDSISWSEKSCRLSCCQMELWDSVMQSRWRGASQFLGFQTSFHGGRTQIWPVSWWKIENLLGNLENVFCSLWIFMAPFRKISGFSWFRWFLRGFMLWSYNGIVMLAWMCMCGILWKLSLAFLDRVPRCILMVAHVAALLGFAILIWLPFRWWYVMTSGRMWVCIIQAFTYSIVGFIL